VDSTMFSSPPLYNFSTFNHWRNNKTNS